MKLRLIKGLGLRQWGDQSTQSWLVLLILDISVKLACSRTFDFSTLFLLGGSAVVAAEGIPYTTPLHRRLTISTVFTVIPVWLSAFFLVYEFR